MTYQDQAVQKIYDELSATWKRMDQHFLRVPVLGRVPNFSNQQEEVHQNPYTHNSAQINLAVVRPSVKPTTDLEIAISAAKTVCAVAFMLAAVWVLPVLAHIASLEVVRSYEGVLQ
jgi:hypothetical protein